MTENKPIINIIFDNLNQGIKDIGEKCLNFQEENKNLKEQLIRKTQECEELKKVLTDGGLHNLTLMSEKQYLLNVITEIKEIAENFCNACKEFQPNKCNEINLRYCNYNKIIQKCEEVNKQERIKNETN